MPVSAHVRRSSVARINRETIARDQPRNHWSEQMRRLGPSPVEPALYLSLVKMDSTRGPARDRYLECTKDHP